MNVSVFVPAIVGAIVGALGWLCVGVFMSHRQNDRQGRSCARECSRERKRPRSRTRTGWEHERVMDGDHQQLADRLVTAISRGDHKLRSIMATPARDISAGDAAVDLPSVRAAATDEHRVLAPPFTVVHVQGLDEAGTISMKSRYPDGSRWWVVVVYETSGGRIVRSTKFFGPEFEPAPFRAPSVELAGPES
jgi:hypothetical protein